MKLSILILFMMFLGTMNANEYSLEKIKVKAEEGDAAAQFDLARYYFPLTAKGIKNIELGTKWYLASAKQGYSAATSSMVVIYNDYEKDYKKALEWAMKGFEKGDKLQAAYINQYYQTVKRYPSKIHVVKNMGTTEKPI